MDEKTNKIAFLLNNSDFREWVLSTKDIEQPNWESLSKAYKTSISNLKEARLLILSLEEPKTDFSKRDSIQLWERIDNTISTQSDSPTIYNTSEKSSAKINDKHKLAKWWYSIAATLLILFLSNLVFNFHKLGVSEETVVQMISKSTVKGQKLSFFLSDGSKVTLNSKSKITYPEKFSESKRELNIEGEVFFEVKKDSLRPFIVKSNQAITQVLGTTFNVNSYSRDKTIISLIEGKVKVSPNISQAKKELPIAILEKGEEITLTKEDKVLTKRSIANYDALLWKDGILAFSNESIEQVFKKLQDWYGVAFVYENQINTNELITGKFTNEYLDNVLKSISYTIQFDFQIKDDTVYINP